MDGWDGKYAVTQRVLKLSPIHDTGRFFAVTQLKVLMSHVLLNFDVKTDKVPPSSWFAAGRFPNQSSNVLFRKRAH
ncbi:hypothetical protein IW262DRAFT_1417741 [Armillaria fumosa]|nr:hypothetical protein IW262DRAFT_1417741 [Armillaria fumosa]